MSPTSRGLSAGSRDLGTKRDSWIPRTSRGLIITHIFYNARNGPLSRERNSCKNNLLNAGRGLGRGCNSLWKYRVFPLPNPLPALIILLLEGVLSRERGLTSFVEKMWVMISPRLVRGIQANRIIYDHTCFFPGSPRS